MLYGTAQAFEESARRRGGYMRTRSTRALTRRAAMQGAGGVVISGLFASVWAAPALRFGVLVPTLEVAFYRRLTNGMKEASASVQATLEIVVTPAPPDESKAVADFLARGVNGLIVAPLTDGDPGEASAVRSVKVAGVRMGAVGRSLSGADVTVLVDPAAVGAVQGEIALTLAQRGGAEQAELLYIYDPRRASGAARLAGLRARLNGTPIKVTPVPATEPDVKARISAIAQALSAVRGAVLVAAADEDLTQSAAAAGDGRVKVIGIGGTADGLRSAGLAASVDLVPEAQGGAVVLDLAAVVQRPVCKNGQNPPCPTHFVPPLPILAEK